MEGGSRHYPRFPQWDMFVPQKALNGRHLNTTLCRRVMERKWRLLSEEEAREGAERAHTAYRFPLSQVTSFKLLGRVLVAEENEWTEVVHNLRSARQKWAWLNRVLIREGLYAWTSGKIYLAVVQSVLLYESETWVLTLCMERFLGGFHHSVAHRLTGQQMRKGQNGGWVYSPLEDAMAEARLQEVETYVSCRQNTVSQYIETGPIMDLFLAAKRRPGPRVEMRWWEREGLD